MIPYLLLTFVPILFHFVRISKKKGKLALEISDRPEIKNNSLIPVFFIILIVVLCLRDETIGRDLPRYKYFFTEISSIEFREIFTSDLDVLYVALNWLVSRFTDNYQILLSVVAIISVVPIAVVYSKDRKYGLLKIMLFLNMSTFVMLFSGLRQAIAITMGVVAYEFVKRKKIIPFLLVALIAWGVHHTGFIVFILYPLYHATFKKRQLIYVVPSFVLVFVFNKQIFTAATNFISKFSSEKDYIASVSENGAYTMIILFFLFVVFSYFIPDEDRMDKEALGLRNILLMTALLQCFAPIHMLAMRINYYFIIFVPMAIPKMLKFSKASLKDVAWITNIVLIVFFMGYYLFTTYNSCRTGISALDIYPYVPFWK